VVIAAEPFSGQLEELQPVVSSFMRIASQHGHKVYVHPATLDDLRETSGEAHRAQNIAAYSKYPALLEVPVPPAVWDVFPGSPKPNDERDARILTALHIGAVHFLVTNDRKLRGRAIRLGHELKVLRPGEAAGQLAAWHPDAPPPPPMVEEVKTYELDVTQQIFESLRVDYYPVFDRWMAKVKRESSARHAWIVRGDDGAYEALALVKMRDQHPLHRNRDAIKLSTFKVAESVSGRRLGELMLKAVLRWAANEPGRPSDLFVEVGRTQERLIEFLLDFGFTQVTSKPGKLVRPQRFSPSHCIWSPRRAWRPTCVRHTHYA
jgi:GNAT superfamily N-acetyltransferase